MNELERYAYYDVQIASLRKDLAIAVENAEHWKAKADRVFAVARELDATVIELYAIKQEVARLQRVIDRVRSFAGLDVPASDLEEVH